MNKHDIIAQYNPENTYYPTEYSIICLNIKMLLENDITISNYGCHKQQLKMLNSMELENCEKATISLLQK